MEQVFEKMLKVTLSNLRQMEKRGLLKYKVIVDDEEHGSLEVAKTSKRRVLSLPFGTMRAHVVPWLTDMQPGDLVEIPILEFPPETVRGNACAWANEKWGRGTYASTINKASNKVELYRFPLEEVSERMA
jgi:hypothetical protein